MKLKQLEKAVQTIHHKIVLAEPLADRIAARVHPKYRLSSKNLFRYLILRTYDLPKLHDNLSDLGISSIRTAEGYVYKNVANVLRLLRLIRGKSSDLNVSVEAIGYKQSKRLLEKHANVLFDETKKTHSTEIMVTLPNEASEDSDLIRSLAKEGMEIARINLSHGDVSIWQSMVKHIHDISQERGKKIKIYMDLSGPKLRTSEIEVRSPKKKKIRNFIKLKEGEHLILTKKKTKGRSASYDKKKGIVKGAVVGLMLPEIIDDIKINDTVYFDDGMIKARVVSKGGHDAELVITKAYKSKLSANKGINLPDTHLRLPSLTTRDIELLPFVCAHADMVGYSFVRNALDVDKLYRELERHKNKDIGVILKIENKESFENLPLILFEAMRRPKIGVMIARGDLAVEIGFERISEVQNQILWLCEAAHIPVIWATQVLENLAKNGVATRAEVSDAAISAQAECVMLNKGPHIIEAVKTLRNIIGKMEGHTSKKKSTLRVLHVAQHALKQIKTNTQGKRPVR